MIINSYPHYFKKHLGLTLGYLSTGTSSLITLFTTGVIGIPGTPGQPIEATGNEAIL
jgi:hypothetical protein